MLQVDSPESSPPPLVEYIPKEGSSVFSSSKKGCFHGRSCFQVLQATAAFTVFCATVGVFSSDVFSARTNLVSRSLLEVLGGAAMGWSLQSILSEAHGDRFKSAVSDYATPIFLIISQIYLNLKTAQQTSARSSIFGFFNLQGGVVLAAYIHSVINRRLGAGVDHPLTETSQEEGISRLKMAIDSSRKRLTTTAASTAVGVAAILTGALVPEAKLVRDYGIILVGRGTAHFLSELWWMYANRKFSKERKDYEELDMPEYSRTIRYYFTINRIILVACHALPGALIAGAGIAAEKNILPVSMTIFAITGLVNGWNEHLRQTRFSEVPIKDLHEIRTNNEKIFPPKSIFGGVKWIIGVPCVLTFIGLTLAGYNPDQNVFQKVDPYVISSVTTFAISLYTAYFFSEGARLAFKKNPDRSLVNTAYYISHYSLGVPMLFIYVMQKLLINDEAIDTDGLYAGIWTMVAWGSLGLALGTEASSRFDSPKPRVVSSLYFALFGRYFINLLSGRG